MQEQPKFAPLRRCQLQAPHEQPYQPALGLCTFAEAPVDIFRHFTLLGPPLPPGAQRAEERLPP